MLPFRRVLAVYPPRLAPDGSWLVEMFVRPDGMDHNDCRLVILPSGDLDRAQAMISECLKSGALGYDDDLLRWNRR